MKAIIQRNLSLNIKYTVVDKKYIPLNEGCGMCCDNCGKLISNIATVKNELNEVFNIGFDCLETILINNRLLSDSDVADYEKVKKMIPKVLRFAKSVKQTLSENKHLNITGIRFEKIGYLTDCFPFYWLFDGQLKSRDNSYVKIKGVDFNFLITTLRNIFPNLHIISD